MQRPARRVRIFIAGCQEGDEQHLRDILVPALHDPVIESVHDRQSLEASLNADAPDLLLTCEEDIGLDWVQVIETASKLAPRTPVIVFTRAPSEQGALRAIDRGAADYIHIDGWQVTVAAQRALREFDQRRRRKEAEDRLRNHINLLQLQQVVATAANEALSPQDVGQSVLDIARAYGHFTLAHLFYVSDEDPLHLRASGIWSGYDGHRHVDFRTRTESTDFSANNGLVSSVLKAGQLEWVPDISAEPRFLRAQQALNAGLRSAVIAPVAAGSEILGVIEFFGPSPAPRDEHLALVFEYVATQLGRVFERDRAECRLESRAREQMVLAELSRKAVDVVSLDEFLAATVRRVEDMLPGCRGMILESTPGSGALRLRAHTDATGAHEWDHLIPSASQDDFGYAMLHGDLLKIDLSASQSMKLPDFLRSQLGSAISASIRLRNELFGALVAWCPRRREFSRNEAAFLRGVANVVATAVEHSTAFHQLQLLGSAVTQSQDSIMITDAQLDPPGPRILFTNPAFTQITGYRLEEVRGLTPRILQGQNTDPIFLQRIRARLGEGKSVHGEMVNYRKNGTEYWVEIQVSPLRGASGDITHFVGIQRDTTERKIAEERLRESEAMLGAAQRLAHLGSWVLEFRVPELEKAHLMWSEESFRIFGYQPGGVEVTQETFFRSVHPDDLGKVKEAFTKALDGHAEYEIDHRVIRPDGTQRIVHEQATCLYDDAGKPVKVLGTVQDITERKEAEEGVRHWKERYELLTKASGHVIFDWDCIIGHLTYGGDTERMLGCPAENLGSSIEEWIALVHPEDQGHFERELDSQMSTGEVIELEYRLRRADNTYITVKDTGYPVRNERGVVTRILGSVVDISSQRELEVQLRRSQ
ncbi:MAG: PAS domain-containing protein [Chthoniobacteraceae bacterium]|jgi:PAS domain S-box-containing protein